VKDGFSANFFFFCLCRGEFYDDYLLNLVVEGQVSLLRSPSQVQEESDSNKWALTQLKMLRLKRRDLLEECLREFKEAYSQIEESGWMPATEAEISRDLLSMQLQPAVMDAYRRYVAIKGIKDDHIPWDKDGVSVMSCIACGMYADSKQLEWSTISSFNFKDDFYTKLGEERISPNTPAQ
jgi:hypothetical protein